MNHHLQRGAAALALPAALVVSGCGSSDSSTQAAATPAATPTATATAAPATTAVRDGALTVKATEYAFSPTAITADAGKLELTLDNAGAIEHEVVVLKTDEPADGLKGSGGRVSEDDSVGEVSETPAGAKKSTTLDLKPGRYVLVCNIPGHYMSGMRATLTVR